MSTDNYDVIVVGASAAGLRCAARLARLEPDRSLVVIEADEAFSYAACGLPYVLSGDIDDVEELHRTADGARRDIGFFADVKCVEVRAGHRAVDVDPEARTLTVTGPDGAETILGWQDLVLATGADPVRLPGQPEHDRVVCFHKAQDLKPLHEGLQRGRIGSVALIGAGFLGCELAEAFTALWGAEVTLIEAADHPLPGLLDTETAALVSQELIGNDVSLCLGAPVASIEADDDQVTVRIEGGQTVTADVAVVAVGVRPAVALAEKAGAKLGVTGAVAVDERMATSVPHVWAAGDVIEVTSAITGKPVFLPLGSLANRQGRTLADILAGREAVFPPVAGAGTLKVFDLNVAATGLTRRAAGDEARSVWTTARDSADYWPESEEIFLQLTYRPEDGKVLGLQAVGKGEVTKRVDVTSTLLARGGTLADLSHVEQAYSPPYAPALEPVAVAAMVALNVPDGAQPLSPLVSLDGAQVLDVRNDDEAKARPLDLPASTHIPQETLRRRMSELAAGRWVVLCERGTRSSEVVRWFERDDIEVQYLGGGWRWRELAGVIDSRS